MNTKVVSKAEAYKQNVIAPREQQVLNLMLTGKTDKEISEELHLTLGTVRVTLENVSKKFGRDRKKTPRFWLGQAFEYGIAEGIRRDKLRS